MSDRGRTSGADPERAHDGTVRGRLAVHTAGLRGGGRGWILLAVAAGWLLNMGTRFAVPALLPAIKDGFGLTNATAGLAITVIWLTHGLAQFPSGVLVDVFDERRLLAGSLFLTALALAALGASPAFGVFLLACAGFGVGTGVYGPSRGLVLSKVFPDRRGSALGATLAAGCLGGATLPVVAGLSVATLGWRATLLGLAPLFLIGAVAVWRTVPATATVPVTTTATDGGGGRNRAGTRAVLAAVADRRVAVAMVALTAMVFGFQALTSFLPTYLVEVKGLDAGTAAGLYSLLFVCGAAFQLGAGGLADRIGSRPVLVGLTALAALPLIALPFGSGVPVLGALVAFVGVRLGVIPVTNATVIEALPADVRGTAWGLLRTVLFVVGSTGSTVVGALADLGYFDEAFVLLAVVTLVAAGLFALLPRT